MSDLLILFCDCHWNWNECLPATGCLVEDTTTGSALKTLLKKWNLYRDFFNSWSWSYEVTPCAQLEVLRKESAQSFQVLPVLIPVSIHTICWDVLTNHFPYNYILRICLYVSAESRAYILTRERNEENEDDVNCRNTNSNEDMIIAVGQSLGSVKMNSANWPAAPNVWGTAALLQRPWVRIPLKSPNFFSG